jgi:hypothetical protein
VWLFSIIFTIITRDSWMLARSIIAYLRCFAVTLPDLATLIQYHKLGERVSETSGTFLFPGCLKIEVRMCNLKLCNSMEQQQTATTMAFRWLVLALLTAPVAPLAAPYGATPRNRGTDTMVGD